MTQDQRPTAEDMTGQTRTYPARPSDMDTSPARHCADCPLADKLSTDS
jgi:hypothetical protein